MYFYLKIVIFYSRLFQNTQQRYISLHCVRSTFAANYKYLSYKYNISQDEWFTDLSHLIKKVDIKFHKDFQNQSTVNTIVELCAIRDDVTECGVLSRAVN